MSAWSPEFALDLSMRLVAWAVFLQALEQILLVRWTDGGGIWSWKTLQSEWGLLGRLLGPVLSGRGWHMLLVFQAVAAGAVLGGWSSPGLLVALTVTALLVSMRFRGTFNGGSDCMTLVVLGAGALASSFGASSERAMRAALGYIALQCVLSYWIAGVAKLLEPAWREGRALREFMALPQYAFSAPARRLLSRPAVSRWLGYGVIVGELLLPLMMFLPGGMWALLAGVSFHLFNFWVLGLNRFFWAWLSAYPALAYWILGRVGQS